MDRTDHFGFQETISKIWKNVTQKNGFWEKWIFEISVKKAKFIGDKCCFFWRSCILGVWTYIWGSGLIFWGSGLIFWGSGLILWGSGLIFWGSGLIL